MSKRRIPRHLVHADVLETALNALLTRVRWYAVRSIRVPTSTALAFNELADALGKPTAPPWGRIV